MFRTRNELAMENMALRQQLSVYGQLKVKPRLKTEDRAFFGEPKSSGSAAPLIPVPSALRQRSNLGTTRSNLVGV